MSSILFMMPVLWYMYAFSSGVPREPDSQPPAPSAAENTLAITTGNENGLFWEVRSGTDALPSFLYGTMHVIGAEDFFLAPLVREKLELSDRLILEVDMDSMDLNAVSASGMLPEGVSMNDFMSNEDQEFLVRVLSDSLGISRLAFESVYSRMKPVFLEQLVILKFLGSAPESYEATFSEIAAKKGVPEYGIESLEDQLELLDKIPLDQQYADLMEFVSNWEETERKFRDMVAAYTSGDLNTLDRIIHEEIEHPGMKEIFLDHRNAAWMPRLREWLQLGNSFIAVGAGHLAGEGGLISLLMADGYKVTPVLRTGEATEAE